MKTAIALTGVAAGTVAYERWMKPWHQCWGATAEERSAPLPGDDLVAEPATQATRGITIHANPEDVWPWLVQLGADRGGFYSYDWLEDVFGLEIHSADVVVDEWQELGVGDLVRADRAGTGGWCVMDIRPKEALVLQVADPTTGRPLHRDEQLRWEFVWSFVLRPDGPGRTRLLVRERTGFGSRVTQALMEPVGLISFVMTRKMLFGIRDRAESSRGRARRAGDASQEVVR